MYVYTLLCLAELPMLLAIPIARLNTIAFALCGLLRSCCFSSSFSGNRLTIMDSPIRPRSIASIVSRTSAGMSLLEFSFKSLGTVMYNVPLLFWPCTVLLLSIALIVKVSLMISICTPNGFSGTPRLAT